jgi:4-amino-4-deoxy-L-arabinose transferase-like glycosyltransferase
MFLLLGIITCVGFLLRIWSTNSVPAILNRDEAALAYNALLLKETGKDEWSRAWPLALESFGDYKLPGYPYLLVVFFTLFGTSDMIVRLPSVLAGTALILLTYFFIIKILKQDEKLGVLGSILVALQPVFFFYSRIGFEANVALTLFISSIFLFLSSKKILAHFAGAVLLLIAVFTYNTPLILLPFLIPVFIWWKRVKNWREWIVPVASSILICIVGFASLASLAKQKSGITIFSDESTWMESVQFYNQYQGITQKILGNRAVFYGTKIVENYLQSFSPEFLIVRGGSHPWHTLPGFSHFYWITYILAGIGIVASIWSITQHLLRKKITEVKTQLILLYLLLVSLLPAVVTVDAPHATRSLFFFNTLVLFTVVGVKKLQEFASSRNSLKFLYLVVGIILVLESGSYFSAYFSRYPRQSADILHGGFTEALTQARQKDPGPIAIIDGDGYQYILAAWYGNVRPDVFFQTVQKHLPDKIGFRYGYKVDNYRFIVHIADRFPEEKTVIEWDDTTHSWQIREFN